MIAAYSGEDHYSLYLKERVENARTTLSELPTLSQLVQNFEPLEEEKRINNALFWKCVWGTSGLLEAPDPISLEELTQFERHLQILDILHWEADKLQSVKGRLGGNVPEHSLGTFAELSVIGHLAQSFGSGALEYEPTISSGGKSDIKITSDKTQVFLEVSTVNPSETERAQQEIRQHVAEKIWPFLNDDVYLHLEIDPLRLPRSNEKFDVSASVAQVIDFVRRTNLTSLWIPKKFSFFVLEFAGLDPDRVLYDQSQRLGGSDLLANIDDEPYRSFARRTTTRMLTDGPVWSFWSGPSKSPVVEVTDHFASPSPYYEVQHSQYLEQIVGKVGREMRQLQQGYPNLIVLLTSNWTVLPANGSHPIDDDFQSLRRRVESYLNQRHNGDLTAVVMYEENYRKSRIIRNPTVTERSNLPDEVLDAVYGKIEPAFSQ